MANADFKRGQCHEIFDLLDYVVNQSHLDTGQWTDGFYFNIFDQCRRLPPGFRTDTGRDFDNFILVYLFKIKSKVIKLRVYC